MLEFSIHRNGSDLTLELPIPIDVLAGELRMLGIEKSLNHITQDDFTLRHTTAFGKHFMRLVQPEDTLHRIATYCNVPGSLTDMPLIQLSDLIMTDRLRDLDHMADYLQYGPDSLYGLIRLEYNGKNIVLPAPLRILQDRLGSDKPAGEIRLAEMKLAPVSETGRQLMEAFQPYSDTIATANMACSIAQNLSVTSAVPAQIVEGARKIAVPLPKETLSFYCPMIVQCYDGEDEDPIEMGHEYLILHEDEVREALLDTVDYTAVTDHLPDALRGKIASAEWDIAKIGGTVYGKITCELRAPLTADEQDKLAGWIYDQNEGSHGDGFEQFLVDTDDGELCVSFWNSSPECYVLPEDEFRAQVLEQDSQGFGGMGGMA